MRNACLSKKQLIRRLYWKYCVQTLLKTEHLFRITVPAGL